MVTRYQKRVSGLLPDRIGIHVEVPLVDFGCRMAGPVGRRLLSKRFAGSI